MYGFDKNLCKPGLIPVNDCNIINEIHFEVIWNQAMYLSGIHNFANHLIWKGWPSFMQWPRFWYTPGCIKYTALMTAFLLKSGYWLVISGQWQFHVDNRFFPIIKFHWHFNIHGKDFKKICSKNLIKFPPMSDREPSRWQHNRIYPQPPTDQ